MSASNDSAPGLPWRRDVAEIEAGLQLWARRTESSATVTDVRVPGNGMANDTALFQLSGEALVARMAPLPDSPCATFPTFDLTLQHRVIELVRSRTEVPVPRVVHYEASSEWLGSPFLVFEAVEGVVAADNPPYVLDPGGWFRKGTPEQWSQLETATIEVLAAIHDLDDTGGELDFLRPAAPGNTLVEQHLASQRSYYEWARNGIRVPVLERALDALVTTLPAANSAVLNWGDSRPGNIIYRQFEPVAVLDWEMAAVGTREFDVAWATFFHKFFAFLGRQFGLPAGPELFEPSVASEIYKRASGQELDDLTWYEAFAGLRFGSILARMSLRNVAFGIQRMPGDGNELMMFAPLLEELLQAL